MASIIKSRYQQIIYESAPTVEKFWIGSLIIISLTSAMFISFSQKL
jgi:hypothetical protein